MTLLQAWGDSLSLCKPQNLKLFLLVTLKSVIEAYKVLAHYWWWLYVIMVVCCFITIPLTTIISAWAHGIFLFAIIVSTRPSLFQKDWTYFKDTMRYFVLAAPLVLVLSYVCPNIIMSRLLLRELLNIYIYLWVLFFLDSPRRIVSKENDVINSFVRALKMLVYNLWLFVIAMVAIVLVVATITVIMKIFLSEGSLGSSLDSLSPHVTNIISALVAPIFICLYTNIYIKKLHDQFDLYFKQPK